jgi:hypothetical protein
MKIAITTIDNPFDPIENFDDWYRFDEQKGYHSCSLLARVSKTSSDLSDADYDSEVEAAIDDIIEMEETCGLVNVPGLPVHIKIKRDE